VMCYVEYNRKLVFQYFIHSMLINTYRLDTFIVFIGKVKCSSDCIIRCINVLKKNVLVNSIDMFIVFPLKIIDERLT
jgi:hypothetical protein